MKALKIVMKYCVDTKTRGWTFRPNRKWNGRNREIEIKLIEMQIPIMQHARIQEKASHDL